MGFVSLGKATFLQENAKMVMEIIWGGRKNPIFKIFSSNTKFRSERNTFARECCSFENKSEIFEILLGAPQNRAHCVVTLTCAFELACPHAFPEAVHLGQSEASQLVSVQLLERKISLWFILQSCSDVQLTELLIHAPSGQFVHHLHCSAGWKMERISCHFFNNKISFNF